MRLNFTPFQIQEFKGLNRRQKTAVYQCAFEAFLAENPEWLSANIRQVFASALGGACAGWIVAHRDSAVSSRVLLAATGGLAGIIIASLIRSRLLRAHLRPYFRRVLDERKDEIAQII